MSLPLSPPIRNSSHSSFSLPFLYSVVLGFTSLTFLCLSDLHILLNTFLPLFLGDYTFLFKYFDKTCKHGVMLYLDRTLYRAFIRLQADYELGRSYAGLLPFVEGLYTLGFLSKDEYVQHRKRYSEKLEDKTKFEAAVAKCNFCGKPAVAVFQDVKSGIQKQVCEYHRKSLTDHEKWIAVKEGS